MNGHIYRDGDTKLEVVYDHVGNKRCETLYEPILIDNGITKDVKVSEIYYDTKTGHPLKEIRYATKDVK